MILSARPTRLFFTILFDDPYCVVREYVRDEGYTRGEHHLIPDRATTDPRDRHRVHRECVLTTFRLPRSAGELRCVPVDVQPDSRRWPPDEREHCARVGGERGFGDEDLRWAGAAPTVS